MQRYPYILCHRYFLQLVQLILIYLDELVFFISFILVEILQSLVFFEIVQRNFYKFEPSTLEIPVIVLPV